MFKKERVLCPVINKTRNTYFLFLIIFFQTLFFMVSGPGHVSTLDKQWNCFPRAVLQTQHLLKHCRTCTCMRSYVLTYHSQEDNCNTKGQSIWFPLVPPRLYKQNTYIGQSSLSLTISGPLRKNRTVFVLYWYWLLHIIHMFLSEQDRTIIKGAFEPKVSAGQTVTPAKWS